MQATWVLKQLVLIMPQISHLPTAKTRGGVEEPLACSRDAARDRTHEPIDDFAC